MAFVLSLVLKIVWTMTNYTTNAIFPGVSGGSGQMPETKVERPDSAGEAPPQTD